MISFQKTLDALCSFCATETATQPIDKPTRVKVTLHSLLDLIMISDPALAKVSSALEVTMSDHFFSLRWHQNLKSLKQAPTYVVAFITTKLTILQLTSPISCGILSTSGIQFATCRRLLFPLLYVCNEGNRRRLHAGKDSVDDRLNAFISMTCF